MLILCDVRVKFDERISQVFDVVSSDNHLLLVHVLAQFVIVLAYIFVVVLLFFSGAVSGVMHTVREPSERW